MYMYTHSHAARLCYISFPLQGPATLSHFPHSRLCSGGGGGIPHGGGPPHILLYSHIVFVHTCPLPPPPPPPPPPIIFVSFFVPDLGYYIVTLYIESLRWC